MRPNALPFLPELEAALTEERQISCATGLQWNISCYYVPERNAFCIHSTTHLVCGTWLSHRELALQRGALQVRDLVADVLWKRNRDFAAALRRIAEQVDGLPSRPVQELEDFEG